MLLLLDNEPDPETHYHVEEVRRHLPDHRVYEYPDEGGEPSLNGVDGVVISGSTAGVYEADQRPWIDDQRGFVRRLLEEEVPTLGVCFGHQIANDALGGTVEHRGMDAALVRADLADDPLFEGVEPVVPAVHGDHVVEPGDGMVPIGSTAGYPYFATRHLEAPLWTVQYHPEFTDRVADRLAADFGLAGGEYTFADSTAPRTYDNFRRLVERFG